MLDVGCVNEEETVNHEENNDGVNENNKKRRENSNNDNDNDNESNNEDNNINNISNPTLSNLTTDKTNPRSTKFELRIQPHPQQRRSYNNENRQAMVVFVNYVCT